MVAGVGGGASGRRAEAAAEGCSAPAVEVAAARRRSRAGGGGGTAGVEVGADELGPAAVEVARGGGPARGQAMSGPAAGGGRGRVPGRRRGAGELGQRARVEGEVGAGTGVVVGDDSARGRRCDGAAKLERRVLWRQWTAALGDDDDGEKEASDRAAGRCRSGGNQENREVLGE